MAAILVATVAAGADAGTPLADPIGTIPTPTSTTTSTPIMSAENRSLGPATSDLTPTVAPTLTVSTPSPTPVVTPAPTPTVAPAPTPKAPPPPPPPNVAGNRCGAIPGEPTGWTRRVDSTFSENTTLGNWPGPVAARDWRSRQAGYSDSSGRGTYNSDKTVTEHDGLLDIYIHSEGNTRYIAAPIPLLGDTVGQRVSLCMRADRIPGYKLAFLLWPADGDGNDRGEIDYPEGKLTDNAAGNAFMHYDPKPAGDPNKDAYSTGTSTVDWHVYTMEWDPRAGYTAFYFDGRLIGRSTQFVPRGPMHYIMQMETYLAGQTLPPPAAGHVLVDWVTISTPG